MLENEFQRADSSTAERFNGIEEMAVQFRPCPPVSNGLTNSKGRVQKDGSVTFGRTFPAVMSRGVAGSSPTSIHQFRFPVGPIVQWQNASFATKRPAFDSRRVHQFPNGPIV